MNKVIFSAALLIGVTLSANADIIASYDQNGNLHNDAFYGQSVTTPAGGPWDDIGFNFIGGDSLPYATGMLYVLSQAYAGTPNGLSSSTPGYLADTGTINSGVWDFSGLTLDPSTQYFFYMDSLVPLGPPGVLLDVSSSYAGGIAYVTTSGGASYSAFPGVSMLFDLTGTQVSDAPEPGTLALLMAGIALFAGLGFRQVSGRPISVHRDSLVN